jgi:hypothetical protein
MRWKAPRSPADLSLTAKTPVGEGAAHATLSPEYSSNSRGTAALGAHGGKGGAARGVEREERAAPAGDEMERALVGWRLGGGGGEESRSREIFLFARNGVSDFVRVWVNASKRTL